MRIPQERELIGKRIVAFEPNTWRDENGQARHNPIIRLDDGSALFFAVEELNSGDGYGVFVQRVRRRL